MERQLPTQATQKEQPVKAPSSSPLQSSSAVTLHPVLRLQRAVGNQAVQRMINSGRLQAKLNVNQPGDVYEQEADQVAEQVMRMANPETSVSDDEDGAKKSLMREQGGEPQTSASTESLDVPPIVHAVLNSAGGQPLDITPRAS